jgi:glycine/D-amino acid oxidase-like deaminating enzyme
VNQNNSKRGYGHAVVIGGSMAGLLASRVLSEHFQRVTVVDRDRYGEDGEFRAGVPQSRHTSPAVGFVR